MQKSTFDTPALYGDHHVTEVRRMLLNLPGVKDVYASSAFQVVQVEFDETQVSHDALLRTLEEAGYLGQIQALAETGIAAQEGSIFRHTATYATVKKTVSFAQKTPYSGRPLWNCPGMGVIKSMDE
ncbi:MAG: copper chaperone [Chloroflexi bacterium]|nr:MAG: copper chaperone [Chloroflexota bacterium]